MDFTVTALKSQHKAITKMESQQKDQCLTTVAQDLRTCIDGQLRRANLRENHRLVTKEELERRRLRSISTLKNGKSVAAMMSSKVSRQSWLLKHGKMKDKIKLTILKGLSGTLPHRVNQSRGRANLAEKMCRRCSKTVETDIHVLSECPFTKGLRVKRHDRVVDALGMIIREKHPQWSVETERSWNVGMRVYRPDITVRNDQEMFLCEVTVPYTKDHDYLIQREGEKCAKYRTLKEHIEQLGRYGKVEVVPIVIGAWGTILTRTCESLKTLQVGSGANLLASVASSGSSSIVRTHLKSNDF